MTFDDLGVALNGLDLPGVSELAKDRPFRHFGWHPAPPCSWGAYAEDDQAQFDGDNRFGESTVIGTVDWYDKTDTGTAKAAIEALFRQLQETEVFAWRLNTIQYEADTHFIHYEWEVELG